MPSGTAYEAPQYVAAFGIGRTHAVGEHEARRADVVGNNAEGTRVAAVVV